jgi:hypothetical protein
MFLLGTVLHMPERHKNFLLIVLGTLAPTRILVAHQNTLSQNNETFLGKVARIQGNSNRNKAELIRTEEELSSLVST